MSINYLEQLQENIQYTKRDLENHKGIGCIIWNKNKTKILMMDHVKFNFWTIPVGKSDIGDSLDKTIKKEMKEELNIKVIKYKTLVEWIAKYKRKSKLVKIHAFVLDIKKYNGVIKNNEPKKHRSIKWMTVDEIRGLSKVSDMTRKFLEYKKKELM